MNIESLILGTLSGQIIDADKLQAEAQPGREPATLSGRAPIIIARELIDIGGTAA